MGIFKGKLDLQKTADGIFSGIDKTFLTKEELIDSTLKAVDNNIEFVRLTQTESTPRSITRRVLAIIIIGQYAICLNVAMFGMISGYYDGERVFELATEALLWAVISVIVFYFGNHMLNTLIPKFANKGKSK